MVDNKGNIIKSNDYIDIQIHDNPNTKFFKQAYNNLRNKFTADDRKILDIYFENIIVSNTRHYTEEDVFRYAQNHLQSVKEKTIFSTNLKTFMDARGLSINELADSMNAPYSTVSDWVNGVTYPRPVAMRRIAEALGINKQLLTVDPDFIKIIYQDDVTLSKKIDVVTLNPNKIERLDIQKSYRIPIFGHVNNRWLNGEKNPVVLGLIDIPQEWGANVINSFFALKMRGTTMEPEIHSGDNIIFEKCTDCVSGQICAVIVGNEPLKTAVIRKVLKNEAGITLMPINEEYEPEFYSKKQAKELPLKIIGTAVELRRKLN